MATTAFPLHSASVQLSGYEQKLPVSLADKFNFVLQGPHGEKKVE